jgi:ATP-dependent 26S proteasome regulatory subunit
MKVNPITTTLPVYSSHQLKADTVSGNSQMYTSSPMNLNLLNKNYNQITFKGPQQTLVENAKLIPLSDRLASLFQHFKAGDVILTGPDIKQSHKLMNKSMGLVKDVIKRAFFVEDDNIGGSLGFVKNSIGDNEIINLNPYPITLTTGGKDYSLKANDNYYVVEGDVIRINKQDIEIKSKPKADLSAIRPLFARAFDFTNIVQPEVEKLNKKSLTALATDTKKRNSSVTFADIGGHDKLIQELKKSIVYPIKYPSGYENIDVNHGLILYGPPGTGKTHIARALSNEVDANFVAINGLELQTKWVGETEQNWRELFQSAKENQPTIIFLDEFESVARNRDGNSNEYGNNVVDQILTLMTDIDNEGDNIFVIGATNNFKALDPAIVRSGRFSKHIEVGLPDKDGIKKIFEIHTKHKNLDEHLNYDKILSSLESLNVSGADIKYIINEAHNLGYERAGIFEKMEKGILEDSDIGNFKINDEDFETAIKQFADNKNVKTRTPIGYKK